MPLFRSANSQQTQSNKKSLQPLVAMRAMRQLLKDPEDTSLVFVILEALSGNAIARNLKRFRKHSVSQRVFSQPDQLLGRLKDSQWLATLPAGSLGQAYLRFTQSENISADGLVDASETERQFDDVELQLFAERLRDMHDLWHVTSQYGRDTLGEVCLLGFTFAQTYNPGVAFIAVMGAAKVNKELDGGVWSALWNAYCDGRRAKWLPGQDWEALLEQPLEDVRQQLHMVPPVAYQRLFASAQPV